MVTDDFTTVLSKGRGRMGGPKSGGPGGSCVCPECGYKTKHTTGQPCSEIECPKCGAEMTRGEVKEAAAPESGFTRHLGEKRGRDSAYPDIPSPSNPLRMRKKMALGITTVERPNPRQKRKRKRAKKKSSSCQ